MAIKQWFGLRAKTQTEHELGDNLPVNSATHVSREELIGLQITARKLRLDRRVPAVAPTAGNHFSRFRGRGMDYAESRIYQPGDDIRNMDWRVTARTGKPHTKLYEEERERPMVMLVDFGPSLFFGSQNVLKSVVAAQVAAILGWAAAKNGDRVGGLIFNGHHQELMPRSGHRGVLNVIRELVNYSDPRQGLAAGKHSGSFDEALKRLRRIVRPGTLVVLISDFYGISDSTDNHLRRLKQHCDMMAIQVIDPLETTAPPPGVYGVSDGQHQGILDIRSSRSRVHYNDYFKQHHQAVGDLLRKNNAHLLQISTADDIARTMQAWFGGGKRHSVQHKVRAA